jgi:hypothetical protein
MIVCPSCKYTHGSGFTGGTNGEWKQINGRHGEFYKLPVKMEQDDYGSPNRTDILGCPNCGQMFMEGRWPNEKQSQQPES